MKSVNNSYMKYHHGLHYDYPSDIHGHMIDPKQTRKDTLNKEYPYYRKDFWYNVGRVIIEFILMTVGVIFVKLKFGLKVYNKENRKVLKKMIKKKEGVITIANHIYDEDYVTIRTAMVPHMGYISMWKNNHLRRIGWMIRLSGSIPVPKEDSSATLSMMRGVDKCLQDGNWFHIYPEASMFYYYEDVRPFVDGAFVFAVRNNKPVVPLAFSYRPCKGIHKLWKKKGAPLINLSFGEPIYPDLSLPMREAVSDLNQKCHAAVKKLMEDNTPEIEEKQKRP